MKNRFADIKAHLADNTGDENITKMVWIVIVFIVGGIMIGLVTTVFNGTVSTWFNNLFADWFDATNTPFDATPGT